MRLSDAFNTGELLKQSRVILAIQLAMVVAVLGGVAYWGAWRLLWFIPTVYPIALLFNRLRRIYWRGFDPFIWRAAEEGRFAGMIGWDVLTVALDWIFNAIPAAVGAYIVCALAGGAGLPPVFGWLALSIAIYPPRPYVQINHTFAKDIFLSSLFIGSLVCAGLSSVLTVTPFQVTVAAFALGAVLIPLQCLVHWKGWRKDYETWKADAARGTRHTAAKASGWFPRKGVIFEPQYNGYDGLKQGVFLEYRRSLTILRANWCGLLLSIATLAFGILGVVRIGKATLILLAPIIVLFGLFYGSITSGADRSLVRKNKEHDPMRGYLMGLMMAALAIPSVYFGGCDPGRLLAVAALFAGLWFVFFGFVVRATSEGVFDTLEFVMTLCGLGCVAASRVYFHCAWWEAILPILMFAFAYPYLRHWFPRTDIPEKREEGSAESGLRGAAKADRRERKRQRQMEAFRRSRGSGTAT